MTDPEMEIPANEELKVPYQFAGNEDLYRMAVRLYLRDLTARALLDIRLPAKDALAANVIADVRISDLDHRS